MSTDMTVQFDPSTAALRFERIGGDPSPTGDRILVPYVAGSPEPTHTITLQREAGATWNFHKLLVWSNLHNEALVEIPVPAGSPATPILPVVIYDTNQLSFSITGFSDGQIVLQNINRNKSSFDIHIHLEVTIESGGVRYTSKDPQVIDEKDTGG